MSSTELPFTDIFICSLLTWTVSAWHQGSFTFAANYFPGLFPSLTCLFVFYPLSLQVSWNQTSLMNHEADICKKETTTSMWVAVTAQISALSPATTQREYISKWNKKMDGSESTLKEWGLVIYCGIKINSTSYRIALYFDLLLKLFWLFQSVYKCY